MDDARKDKIRSAMQRLVDRAQGKRVAPVAEESGDVPKPPEATPTVEQTSTTPPGGKLPISLRLDADVLEILRRSGRGWQTRLNRHLREAVGLEGGDRDRDLLGNGSGKSASGD